MQICPVLVVAVFVLSLVTLANSTFFKHKNSKDKDEDEPKCYPGFVCKSGTYCNGYECVPFYPKYNKYHKKDNGPHSPGIDADDDTFTKINSTTTKTVTVVGESQNRTRDPELTTQDKVTYPWDSINYGYYPEKLNKTSGL